MNKAIWFDKEEEEIFNKYFVTAYDDPENLEEIAAERKRKWEQYCEHFNGHPDISPLNFFFPEYNAKPLLNGKGVYGRIFIKRKDV